MKKEERIAQIRATINEAELMRDAIGTGSEPSSLSDRFLSVSPNDTLTGQAYEDLHFVYDGLQRFIDGAGDVIDAIEHEE